MKTVIIESPYAGDIQNNLEYAKEAAMDCLNRKESPFASHLFYTQFLDDKNPRERRLGINAGYAWWKHADLIVFYTDHGWSPGMRVAYERCQLESKKFSLRAIYGFATSPGEI